MTVKRPWEVLDREVFPYLSVESLYSDLRALRRDGRFWQASCPIHGDQQGAFSIDPERLEWNCFLGCGGGGPVQYLETVRGLSWLEAARELVLMAGVAPDVLETWSADWTEEDFRLHDKLERRSSLLRVFMAYARSVFRSGAGQTLRRDLVNRLGFNEPGLESINLGLYTAPEDVWHYLKKTGRDLEEVRTWGLFDARWAGCIVGPWKDLSGRTVNLWGWQSRKLTKSQTSAEECVLFEKEGNLYGKSVPFNLDRAARLKKRDLLLLEEPVKALFAQSLGLLDPFPIAAGGSLNNAQITALEEYLGTGGSLTLCWDYEPPSNGRRKDKTALALDRLKAANFAIYVVDPSLMTDRQRRRQKISVTDFVLRYGRGKRALQAFEELVRQREAQIDIHRELPARRDGGWTGLLEMFGSNRPQALEPLFRAAEEFGRRLAQGFLKALPAGLVGDSTTEPLQVRELPPAVGGELTGLPAQVSEAPAFSVRRLEEEARATPRGLLAGWAALDQLEVAFNPGEVTTVVGRTGHGKTSVLLGLLLHWLNVTEDGENPLFLFYCVGEPEVQIYHRLLSLLTAQHGQGWTLREIRNYFEENGNSAAARADLLTLAAARDQVRCWENCLQIVWQPNWTLADLEGHARAVSQNRTVGAVFVDHLQALYPTAVKAGDQKVNPVQMLRRLKSLAVDLACPMVIAAPIGSKGASHRGRIPRDRSFQDDRVQRSVRACRPQLSWLRDRAIEQEADLILGVLSYAAEYRNQVGEAASIPRATPLEIGTLKNRYGPVGSWADLAFEGAFGLIREDGVTP